MIRVIIYGTIALVLLAYGKNEWITYVPGFLMLVATGAEYRVAWLVHERLHEEEEQQ